MTDTEAVRRLFDELAGEYDQHVPFFATFGRELAAWCGLRPRQRALDMAAGRGAVAGPAARASFAIHDPRHYWDWIMSHGFRGYIYFLGPRLAGEFRARMFAGLERMHASGGITLVDTVTFTRMRKP
jgi:hypothetical protein